MLRTSITDLFGIKHPIILAGMNLITKPTLVAAVCNAGGLGILGCASGTPDELRENIREIRTLTDKPFGINQTLHVPLARNNIEVAIAEKVPVINYSLGKPWFIKQVHEYGGKVIGTIAISKHAAVAEKMGVDAIIVTGNEAAAHGASGTSLVLIPLVASAVKTPIIAAGGFYDGRGLAAALVLGASAISMGTRFMITQESLIHGNYKHLCMKASEEDTLYSDVFDGLPGRVLKTKTTIAMMRGGFPLIKGIVSALEVKRMMKLSTWQFICSSLGMMKGEEKRTLFQQARFATGMNRLKKALEDGDEKEGFIFAGQNCGAIRDIPLCQELIERVVSQAEATLESLRENVIITNAIK